MEFENICCCMWRPVGDRRFVSILVSWDVFMEIS